MKLFEYDGNGTKFLRLLSTCLVISVEWLLFSLPIFTIGASSAAMYDMTARMHRGEMMKPWHDFRISFKEHFKKATLTWLPLLILYIILFVDYYFIRKFDASYSNTMLIILSVLILLLFFITVYVFPMLLVFSGSSWQLLWNALCLSILNVPYSILMVALYGGMLYLMSRFIFLTVFGLLVGPGLIAWINTFFLLRIFKKYLPKEPENEETEDSREND